MTRRIILPVIYQGTVNYTGYPFINTCPNKGVCPFLCGLRGASCSAYLSHDLESKKERMKERMYSRHKIEDECI